MQNGQRPRQKERKKKKNQQFRTVEFWIITSVRSARAEQNSQLSFFFKFPLDDRQLCLDRLSTNGRLDSGGGLARGLMTCTGTDRQHSFLSRAATTLQPTLTLSKK